LFEFLIDETKLPKGVLGYPPPMKPQKKLPKLNPKPKPNPNPNLKRKTCSHAIAKTANIIKNRCRREIFIKAVIYHCSKIIRKAMMMKTGTHAKSIS